MARRAFRFQLTLPMLLGMVALAGVLTWKYMSTPERRLAYGLRMLAEQARAEAEMRPEDAEATLRALWLEHQRDHGSISGVSAAVAAMTSAETDSTVMLQLALEARLIDDPRPPVTGSHAVEIEALIDRATELEPDRLAWDLYRVFFVWSTACERRDFYGDLTRALDATSFQPRWAGPVEEFDARLQDWCASQTSDTLVLLRVGRPRYVHRAPCRLAFIASRLLDTAERCDPIPAELMRVVASMHALNTRLLDEATTDAPLDWRWILDTQERLELVLLIDACARGDDDATARHLAAADRVQRMRDTNVSDTIWPVHKSHGLDDLMFDEAARLAAEDEHAEALLEEDRRKGAAAPRLRPLVESRLVETPTHPSWLPYLVGDLAAIRQGDAGPDPDRQMRILGCVTNWDGPRRPQSACAQDEIFDRATRMAYTAVLRKALCALEDDRFAQLWRSLGGDTRPPPSLAPRSSFSELALLVRHGLAAWPDEFDSAARAFLVHPGCHPSQLDPFVFQVMLARDPVGISALIPVASECLPVSGYHETLWLHQQLREATGQDLGPDISAYVALLAE